MLTYFIAFFLIIVTIVAFISFAVMAFEAILSLIALLFRLLSIPLDMRAFFHRQKAGHNGFEDAFGE